MTSVDVGRFIPAGFDRGPLWRRSASRSAMNGWRDFVLRGSFSRGASEWGGSSERICEAGLVSREQG
jgi:hypothetical protein